MAAQRGQAPAACGCLTPCGPQSHCQVLRPALEEGEREPIDALEIFEVRGWWRYAGSRARLCPPGGGSARLFAAACQSDCHCAHHTQYETNAEKLHAAQRVPRVPPGNPAQKGRNTFLSPALHAAAAHSRYHRPTAPFAPCTSILAAPPTQLRSPVSPIPPCHCSTFEISPTQSTHTPWSSFMWWARSR